MTIRHHLSDSLLMAYSAGVLSEAFNLVIAAHVSLCDDCRARLMAYDAIGGALIEGALADRGDVEPIAEESFEAAMERITGLPREWHPFGGVTRPAEGIFPAPLRDAVGGDLDAVRWRPVGRGVRQAILRTQGAASVRLLSIPGGQAVPDHGHRGTELTLVLQGAFRDKTDRFGPGDIEIATEGFEHTPVAEAGADCICLAASDAPLRFKSLMPRIAQPFLRI
jgi:putative transcriptional regulator